MVAIVWAEGVALQLGSRRGLDGLTRTVCAGGTSGPLGATGAGTPSLVRRIAESHGGSVFAENRAEGGARVGIELPTALLARR